MGVSRSSRGQHDTVPGAHPAPGTTIVVAVLVALLILFLWLHFIVAHENELIGREIQAQTKELERIERENMALRRQAAAIGAEPIMAERARALGYSPQQPVYLLLSHPLLPAAGGSHIAAPLLPEAYGTVLAGPGAGPRPGANPIPAASSDDSAAVTASRP